jgi:hypothetical protein
VEKVLIGSIGLRVYGDYLDIASYYVGQVRITAVVCIYCLASN